MHMLLRCTVHRKTDNTQNTLHWLIEIWILYRWFGCAFVCPLSRCVESRPSPLQLILSIWHRATSPPPALSLFISLSHIPCRYTTYISCWPNDICEWNWKMQRSFGWTNFWPVTYLSHIFIRWNGSSVPSAQHRFTVTICAVCHLPFYAESW